MIAVEPQSYRRMIRALREFEGMRFWWYLLLSTITYGGVRLLALVGAVVGIYIGSSLRLIDVLAGCAVTLGTGEVFAALRRRKPWHKIIARRLWTFEAPTPATDTPVLINENDADILLRALRRAHFNPTSTTRVGAPPVDAQDLQLWVRVQEPERWSQSSSDADRIQRIRKVLMEVGLRGRVSGRDVFPLL